MNNRELPAFPVQNNPFVIDNIICAGLTKREWFAGMALQGLLASAGFNQDGGENNRPCRDMLPAEKADCISLAIDLADMLDEELGK